MVLQYGGIAIWRYFLGGTAVWWYYFGGSAVWWYFFGGIEGGTFSGVPGTSFLCGAFSTVMQYGGTFSVVPGISCSGGTDFGGPRYCQNMDHGLKITAGIF